ncbi:MAG: HAD-IB family phosphatase, partial [Candidatus Freyarchaeota archaeon]
MNEPKRLVVFDVEGVLLPKRRYLLFEVARKLNIWTLAKIFTIGLLYEIGLLSVETALKKTFMTLRGLTVDELFQLYLRVPLIPNAKMVVKKLKDAGYKVALISSGMPKIFVEDLATRLGADYAFGLNLENVNGWLTGRIWGDVVKPSGKAVVLERIMKMEGISRENCVVVVDDRNNLPMFPLSALRIGYNPDYMVSFKSDVIVKVSLAEVLPLIVGGPSRAHPPLSWKEFTRETIHISSFLVPFLCMYALNRYVVAFLILLVTLVYITSEFARLRGSDIPLFSTMTWKAAIEPELYEFVTAPIFFALGIIFSLVFLPQPEGYASIAILTLGDGFATLSGRLLGRSMLPFNKGKSLEGFIFGLLFSFLGASFFVGPMKALIGSVIGMVVECLPSP